MSCKEVQPPPSACEETLRVLSRRVRRRDLALSRAAGRGSGGGRLSEETGHWGAANSGRRALMGGMGPTLLSEIFVPGAQGRQGFVLPLQPAFWFTGAGREGTTCSRAGGSQDLPAPPSHASHCSGPSD